MIAKTKKSFYIGCHSFFDKKPKVNFEFVEKNDYLLNPYKGNHKVQRLIEITKESKTLAFETLQYDHSKVDSNYFTAFWKRIMGRE